MKRDQAECGSGTAGSHNHEEPGGSRANKGIHWDEENLEKNEKIKAELMPTKINEPKTPYHAPLGEENVPDDEDADMAPLTLEDDPHRLSNGSIKSGGLRRSKERTHITIAEASHRLEETCKRDMEPSMSRSSGGYSSSGGGGYASDRGGGYASCSSDGEGLTSEAKSLKRRKFEQRRKQHYNMKEALQKGKQLADRDLRVGSSAEELQGTGTSQGPEAIA